MKNKLFIACGIIALFLGGNRAFATEPETPKSEGVKNNNCFLDSVATVTMEQINATMAKRIDYTNKLTDPREVILTLEEDIQYVDSCRAKVQSLRAKIANNNQLIEVQNLNSVFKRNKKIILKLTDFDDKLQVASDNAKDQVKNAR